MNKGKLFLLTLFSLAMFAQTSQAQILYSEDFEGTGGVMPTMLTIIDGDASPANTNVAAFDMWVLSTSTESATTDTVAAVTSWQNPAGAADDWLITPQVAGIAASTNLSWNAVARDPSYADGYEVWVTSSIAGATPVITDFTTGGTMVFSIAAEDTNFVAHTVSLSTFAGQSVYVGFRNNSFDKFILEIDDILIENTAVTLTTVNTTTPATCGAADGTATSTPSGGAAPYTFMWDAAAGNQTTATATGLAAGTYMFTYTDNNSVTATSSVSVGSAGGSVLYSEDFEGTGGVMPTMLTIIDGDASPANTNVAAFDMWVLSTSTESATTDTVAAVTSWQNPAGAADDWLITPQVSGILTGSNLSWNAVARDPSYADGYEVWVTSSIAGATPVITDFTTGGTMVFSIAAEDTNFVAHTVSLSAFNGQSVYVGFRNNSFDKFILEIDDIVIDAPCATVTLSTVNTTTDATCGVSDGTATSTPSGGAAPYTFMWDAAAGNQTTATATGLAAGTYMFTYTDNNSVSATSSVSVGSAGGVVLYNEDFEGTGGVMPTMLTVIDGDASPANANVAAFDMWVLSTSTESATTDTVAAVTSWLNPAGAADDWLITPQVAGVVTGSNLSWNAVARDPSYADGYEVWVTSSIAGATPVITDFTTGGTMVFSIAAEDTNFVAHTVSLSAFNGQSVYVGFRNNSFDKFILEIDDIMIDAPCPTTVTLSTVNTTTDASCGAADGTATSTPSGGASPYTFMWDAAAGNQTTATATGLAAGTYMFTYTDNNSVTATSSVTVSNPNAPTASSSVTSNYNGENVTCMGASDGQATAVGAGGTPGYTYMWDAAAGSQTDAIATGLAAGVYAVTVTDAASCVAISMVTVTEPTAVVASAVDNANGSATASGAGGTAPYTYMWDAAAGNQTTATATGLINSTYGVTVTDANGCMNATTVTIVGVAVGNISGLNVLNMFPNPATANVFVDMQLTERKDVNIRVMNVTGQTVLENNVGSIESKRIELTTENLPSGVYMVQFNIGTEMITKKLTIARR